MWKFKPFTHKEPAGLEGRSVDVGSVKIHVQKAIAEGGFSCVYLARDAVHMSKQYALKHIICNDEESLALVKKEISVMKLLVGHPNVVTLHAHTIFDMGRTKEAFIVMEFCEKSLVTVLESRGAAYFDEKQILLIFRDVCNAVISMHCQSPPIAHRDLKAENLLLGSDGLWKLCDFGSTTTNHKRFEKPEEMGIEEDNIRKYTTPAYRAPEMWDLFLREVINEKVDVWALGCLLFRICYFKSAFDGESKLQVLNGNYRIPDSPKYSSSMTDLIRDMLQARPDDRPDITQARALLDWPFMSINLGASLATNKSPPMPRRSPPPPPSSGEPKNTSQPSPASRAVGSGGALGAFWSSQHAKDTVVPEEKSKPIFDEEQSSHHISLKHDTIRPDNDPLSKNVTSANRVVNTQTHTAKSSIHGKPHNPDTGSSKDIEINFFQPKDHTSERRRSSVGNTMNFQDQTFISFVADFDTTKFNSSGLGNKSEKEEALEAELEKLKEQLKEAKLEKAEITSKYEKLSSICRSQRQELQDLKQALAVKTPSPSKEGLRTSPGIRSPASVREKIGGTVREHQQDKTEWKTPSSEPKSWKAFPDEPQKLNSLSADNTTKSVRTRNGQQHNKHDAQLATDFDTWGFGTDNFSAVGTGSPQMLRPSEGSNIEGFSEAKAFENKSTSQPAGWAGF
ncbi:hypothetical protein TanjilG_14320 [Lupinus angustifolius]|uniref:non-specific serine/threonine protein kinase n=1 Tax=Lupinus angustifolius TaxID=3871 RepID=A0A1J7HGL3_LUPAN|nr:hypothetical protein TanjilG_14320 [Lupinus angustifolius]